MMVQARTYRIVIVVVLGAAAALGVGFVVAYAADVSLSSLTRDVQTTEGFKWYVGSVSTLGVLVWAGGSAIALAASWRASEPDRGFLRAVGLLGLVLAADDAFLVHEEI